MILQRRRLVIGRRIGPCGVLRPFKGAASYFSFVVGGQRAENAAWTYAAPYDEAAALKDHLAFYPQRVDAISVA